MNQVSKGLMGSPSTPKVRDVVIGLGKPKRLSYGNAKLEWAEDAWGKEMGWGCLWAMECVKKAWSSMNASPVIILGHCN